MTDLPVTPALPASASDPAAAGRLRAFYNAAWRWHFYAGLYVAPFLVMLAVTGLLMLWSSVLAGRDGENIFVPTASSITAVSKQAEAALSAEPGGTILQYIAPRTDGQVALFQVKNGDKLSMVAVDPYRGTVVDRWDRRSGLYDIAETIHGTLLIGDTGDRLIEIAAGFGVVLVITGLYMWWPRRGEPLSALLVPSLSAKGRQRWKDLHRSTGFYVSILLLAFLISGMSWTGIWGGKFVQAWSTFPAAKWDNVPLSDATHAAMNHGDTKDVPWGLEQTPMPMSGSMAGMPGMDMPAANGETAGAARAPADAGSLDAVVALARSLGFDHRFTLNFPQGDTGVWTISRDTMSYDSGDPTSDRTVHVDRYTGNILADVGYADYSVPAKAMAVGIAFHEGEMGVWNIALNTVFCLAVIFISASGVAMWWMRRPKGATRLVAPALPADMPLWRGAVLVMLAVSLLFPLVGLTLIAVLALDLLVIGRIPRLSRALR